ncbi:TPA: hypothetical protein ACKQD1_005083, partial [Serratia marcescens]
DFKFNAEQIDKVVNSNEMSYVDRFGVSRFTIEGMRSLISPLGKTYTKEQAESAIAAGEIPNDAFFFIWSNDNGVIARQYKNSNGVITDAGKAIYSNDVSSLEKRNSYLRSELFSNQVSSIDFNDVGSIKLSDASLIRITDVNTHDAFLSTIQFSQVSSPSMMKRWYFPNHTQYSNGVISSNYQSFYYQSLSFNEFSELTERYARVRYTLPDNYNLVDENNRYRVVDTSGTFKPSFAGTLTSETVSCISAHATKNIVQFFVVLSEIVSEGYEPNQAGVLSFIADKTDSALMMAYSGVYGAYTLREDQFDIIIPAGEYTIDVVGDVGVAATIRQRKK